MNHKNGVELASYRRGKTRRGLDATGTKGLYGKCSRRRQTDRFGEGRAQMLPSLRRSEIEYAADGWCGSRGANGQPAYQSGETAARSGIRVFWRLRLFETERV